MKKLFLLTAALLACHTMQAQYFCTTPGSELHYVNYDEAGQSVSDETITVTNVIRESNTVRATYLDKIVTTKAKNNTSYTLFNWNYDGTNTTCTEDLMYEPYIASDSDPDKYGEAARLKLLEERKFKGDNSFTLKKGAKAGETMPDIHYQLIRNMLKNEITISGASYMGEEQVSTTAGKFHCIKISYLKRTKILLKTTNQRITEWYAEGTGLIKSETYNMEGELEGKTLLVKRAAGR